MDAFGNNSLFKYGAITDFNQYLVIIGNPPIYLRDIRSFDHSIFVKNKIVRDLFEKIKLLFGINYDVIIDKKIFQYVRYIEIYHNDKHIARINISFQLYMDKTFNIVIYCIFPERISELHYKMITEPIYYDDGMIAMSIKYNQYVDSSFDSLFELVHLIISKQ